MTGTRGRLDAHLAKGTGELDQRIADGWEALGDEYGVDGDGAPHDAGTVREHEAGQLFDRQEGVEAEKAPALARSTAGARGSGRRSGARWVGRWLGCHRRGCRERTTFRAPSRPGRPPGGAPDGRLGPEAPVAAGQPCPPSRVAAPLPAEVANGGPVVVLNRRIAAELEAPAPLLQTPGEVGVLRRPHALIEAPHLRERAPAHEQVGRRRPRFKWML